MTSSTFERILEIVRKQQNIETSAITPDSALADAGLDSLAIAELLFTIEEDFGIELGDVPADQVPATMQELVALVDGRLSHA